MTCHFEPIPAPWTKDNPVFPMDWLGNWMRGSHRQGRARLQAVVEVHRRLERLGICSTALVSSHQISTQVLLPDLWRSGPWPAEATGEEQLWAEGAGETPADWLWPIADTYLRHRQTNPPDLPVLCWAGKDALVLDPALGGRRPAVLVFKLQPRARAMVVALLHQQSTWWGIVLVSSALRADAYWTHWNQLAEHLVTTKDQHDNMRADPPVNPQEVVARVAEMATAYTQAATKIFEAAAVGLFMPDAEDEYVYALATSGYELFAYDAGIVRTKPQVQGIGYGLTASYVVGPAYDPSGGEVVVRHMEHRDELYARYRDLGFDEDEITLVGAHKGVRGPFLAEKFLDDDIKPLARSGPWLFTAQRLPPYLSPTARNLVLRIQGRTLMPWWHTPTELSRTSRDRRARVAALAMRAHSEICRVFSDGLAEWRQGLRREILRELAGPRRWPTCCQLLASWFSARLVSLFKVDGEISLFAWSRPSACPEMHFDPVDMLDASEMRLLQASLFPRRDRISDEGFLGWPNFEDAIGRHSENVGTIPIIAGGRTVALLRIDGAMSLFGGHISRRSVQGGLHHHRPTMTPFHLRPVLEEVSQLIALSLASNPLKGEGLAQGWSSWVQQVTKGLIEPEEIRARLTTLKEMAPNQTAAATELGIHRNTFRRHLQAIARALKEDEPLW